MVIQATDLWTSCVDKAPQILVLLPAGEEEWEPPLGIGFGGHQLRGFQTGAAAVGQQG